jgi:lysine-N-methylase
MGGPAATGAATAAAAGFACLGAACEDTCCRGWDMQVDPPHLELYRRERPGLAEAVETEGGRAAMRRTGEAGTCVKLADGLCSVHAAFGPNWLGDACHFYPRIVRWLGGEARVATTLSCPEAARLLLFGDDPFARRDVRLERLPFGTREVADGLGGPDARAICAAFEWLALDPGRAPGRALRVIVSLARSLGRLPVAGWPAAVGVLLRLAPDGLCAPEPEPDDELRLLHALVGLMRATRHRPGPRLEATVATIERALGVRIDRESLDVWGERGREANVDRLRAVRAEQEGTLAPVLRRWIAAELVAADFPFAGLGATPADRATILAVRYATLRLALASHAAEGGPEDEAAIVRIAQCLARFLDHLAEPMLSLALYRDAGWTREARLAGLVEPAGQILPGKACPKRQHLPGSSTAAVA